MRLIAREFLTCLVILFIIGGLKANVSFPEPASCKSDKDCLKEKAKCVQRKCQCIATYGDGKSKCNNYDFHFPAKGVHDVVKMSQMPRDLTAFTVCLWMRSSNPKGTLVSYAVPKTHDELMIEYNKDFGLHIGGKERRAKVTAIDGAWHHICLVWTENSGIWAIFKDGLMKHDEENFMTGHTIKKGGTLVLGQDQEKVDGDFKKDASFQGMLSYVNVWDRFLDGSEIEVMSLSCVPDKQDEANVYKWIDFLRQGGPKLVEPSNCVTLTSSVKCSHSKECRMEYSRCEEGKCFCQAELILGPRSCEPAPLHSCINDKDCHSHATCEDGKCVCQGKRTGNGKNCRDSEPCYKDCGPGGTCLKEKLMPKDDAVCRCDKGYNKTKDGKCVECTENANCGYGTCIEGECECKYNQVKEGRICKRAPLHPCKTDGDCDENAVCYLGKCHCSKNTTGNGKYCRDSLPCKKEDEEKCKAFGSGVISCVVDPLFRDQPECQCHTDFRMSEAGICVEITECEKEGKECPPGKVCKLSQKDSRYECLCEEGYEEGNSTCRDINECSTQDPCLGKENSVCANTEGSFNCECMKGFRMSADRTSCKDVDECLHDETLCNKVNEECLNQQGSFFCVCRSGYRRVNKVCVKKEQCIFKCTQQEICVAGECKCKDGYKKSAMGYCVPRRHLLDESLGLSLHSIGFPSTLFICMLGYLAFTD